MVFVKDFITQIINATKCFQHTTYVLSRLNDDVFFYFYLHNVNNTPYIAFNLFSSLDNTIYVLLAVFNFVRASIVLLCILTLKNKAFILHCNSNKIEVIQCSIFFIHHINQATVITSFASYGITSVLKFESYSNVFDVGLYFLINDLF